jgi:hypothetical protein
MIKYSSKQGGDARMKQAPQASSERSLRWDLQPPHPRAGASPGGGGRPISTILILTPIGRGQASPLHFVVFRRGSGWFVDRNRSGRCLADRSRGDRRTNNMPGLYLLSAMGVYAIAEVSEKAKCEANTVQTEQHIASEQGGDSRATYDCDDCSDVREGSSPCCQSQSAV